MKTILIANQKGGCGKTMAAVNIAAALAGQRFQVGLADADAQKSSLQWLKQRSSAAAPIFAIDWRSEKDIGNIPAQQLDFLVIDAPGAITGDRAEQLVAESDALVVPVQPSFFDIDSTRRFLKNMDDIKRIRKGKVMMHLVANRVRTQALGTQALNDIFTRIGMTPTAWITERVSYPQLAAEGLSVFDFSQKPFQQLQQQWQPLLQSIRW